MKKEVSKGPKVAVCRTCRGTGSLLTDYRHGPAQTCPQCQGSGLVSVSYEMTLDIRPYRPLRKE